ncbi:serine O-acetyltransferase [Haloplanus vescus]|uniref:Serine acetyltransferase n=1 Tax=Haloplanus vescus TaxID=555874 RepID=A0A1H3WGX8_9EURY|nr:serine O-acetyltransferase [Haloplanus vescus]SDZ85654.1 serine O-acetyltransferase [Haloplanus vescus]
MFERSRRLLGAARERVREDLDAIRERDPAAGSLLVLLTCYPGLHALWAYRVAHLLWERDNHTTARLLSQFARFVTGVEIHPAADIGRRCVIDHGTGVVVGSTAEIGDDVLLYHGVTLGNRRPVEGKRHPTVGDDVLLGANATVLGPIEIGDGATVGGAAVVVQPVEAGTTVVGNPAKPVDRVPELNDTQEAAEGAQLDRIVCDGGDHPDDTPTDD